MILICNCQERESGICLCDVAFDEWDLTLILTLCAFYRLPCVILANEVVTRGLDPACVALDLNLKNLMKDHSAIFKTQGLKCKNKIISVLDCFL